MKKVIAIFFFLSFSAGCNKADVTDVKTVQDEINAQMDNTKPLETRVVNTPAQPTPPLEISLEKLPPLKFQGPEEHEDFIKWVSTKLDADNGLLKGIITAKYKGRKLRVALVYYGDRSWQYIYDPIIMNKDLKKIFGFFLGGISKYDVRPVKEIYPCFVVPPDDDKRFVKVVHRHMKMSNLLKELEIVWESEEGVQIYKPPVGC